MPTRERYLFVCINRRDKGNPKGSCAQEDSEELMKRLKGALKAQGIADRVRVASTSCLDLCECAAAVVMEPEHVVYAKVHPSDAEELARATGEGRVVERLLADLPGAEGRDGGRGPRT